MIKTVFSGMRPTGRLHLGHLVGALQNWVKLQDTHRCVYCIVDWHALMGEYEHSENIKSYVYDMAADWLACGVDPQRSIVFVQSQVPEHLELQMFLSCLTPLGWLERNPTYKEQLREITTRDLQTYAFLGYPVLQAADILLYKANAVPIGEDQLPHLELTREIARRFNSMYACEVFQDCAAILTPTPRLLGLDGRKMSKSYQNTINLADAPEEIAAKVKTMFTDPKRLRLKDPGHPDECNVFAYYKAFVPARESEVRDWCEGAKRGCTECKKILAEALVEYLRPIREKRSKIVADRGYLDAILDQGALRAKAIAVATMQEVRKAVFR
ncbi:MAG: tryptophan--tRNA ligase [Candidatus Omnitrophica bacterium]|nr:tryptophan--tRNA ligase [Candidatus Omnitrophota bacterium]